MAESVYEVSSIITNDNNNQERQFSRQNSNNNHHRGKGKHQNSSRRHQQQQYYQNQYQQQFQNYNQNQQQNQFQNYNQNQFQNQHQNQFQNYNQNQNYNSSSNFTSNNNYQYNNHYYKDDNYYKKNRNNNKNISENDKKKKVNKSIDIKNTETKIENDNYEKKKKVDKTQKKKIINETRTEILIEQLTKNKYECMVCCFVIKHDTAIWQCDICNHVFHLFCIKKWARSPAAIIEENSQKWRCPGCQTPVDYVPNKYTCYCKKKIDPEYNNQITPHSCGEVCGKPKVNPNNSMCSHKCTLLCHPGPCPPCEAMIYRECGCAKLKFQVKCNSNKIPQCDNTCNKILNCGIHNCELKCHSNECPSCDIDINQYCYSHNKQKIVKCGVLKDKTKKNYNCNETCDRYLNCKQHKCEKNCHSGACEVCSLLPENLKLCPCGKTSIISLPNGSLREKCTDPIPTCEKICDKLLPCSTDNDLHFCQSKCHLGECQKCEKIVKISCRCGSLSKEMTCNEAQIYKINPLMCEKRCTKKQSCGRHRCTEICCDIKDHICTFICNRLLNCGKHNCEQLCHKGNCLKCSISSYDEWVCHCGKTIMYPPIKCGTKPPTCSYLCQRQQNCDHPVQHKCHEDNEPCAPCSFLTEKMCMGNHEIRKNIACYIKDVSCGKQCGKELPCGKHKCIKICHKGSCLEENEICTQPCQIERLHCIHQCMSPCHPETPCPDTFCQAVVKAKCKCGLKSKEIKCLQRYYDSSSVVFENLASEITEMLSCKTVDISSFRNTENLKKKYELDCDDECKIAERNRLFAAALQIDPNNPTPKPQMKTIYSEFLKVYARDNQKFTLNVEDDFAKLLKDLNASKLTKKFYNFPEMNSIERKFIHELASYYNLDSESNEKEPNRSVRVYATKDKSIIPNPLLSQSVEIKQPKQNIIPHVPFIKPIRSINLPTYDEQDNKFEIKPSSFAILGELDEHETNELINNYDSKRKQGKEIDYFDMTD